MPDDARSNVAPLGIREYLAVLYRRRMVLVLGDTRGVRDRPLCVDEGHPDVQGGRRGSAPGGGRPNRHGAHGGQGHRKRGSAHPRRGVRPRVGEVSTSADPTVNLITVTAESEKPKVAAATVNEHMDAYVAYTRQAELNRYLTAVKVLQPVIDDLQKQIEALGASGAAFAGRRQSSRGLTRRTAETSRRDSRRSSLIPLSRARRRSSSPEASPPSSPVSPKPTRDAADRARCWSPACRCRRVHRRAARREDPLG